MLGEGRRCYKYRINIKYGKIHIKLINLNIKEIINGERKEKM